MIISNLASCLYFAMRWCLRGSSSSSIACLAVAVVWCEVDEALGKERLCCRDDLLQATGK